MTSKIKPFSALCTVTTICSGFLSELFGFLEPAPYTPAAAKQPNETYNRALFDQVIDILLLPASISCGETNLRTRQNLMTIPILWPAEEFGLTGDPLLAIAKP